MSHQIIESELFMGYPRSNRACSWRRRLFCQSNQQQRQTIDIESASTSGPEGSTAVGVGDSVKIDTFGANLVS